MTQLPHHNSLTIVPFKSSLLYTADMLENKGLQHPMNFHAFKGFQITNFIQTAQRIISSQSNISEPSTGIFE